QKANLRTALNAAKKALGEETIEADREAAWLNPTHIETSLQTAERVRKTGSLSSDFQEQVDYLEQEIELLKSDYLQGWSAEWIEPVRSFWQQRRTSAMIELALLCEKNDHYQQAEHMAQAALQRDPYREDAISCMMRLLAR